MAGLPRRHRLHAPRFRPDGADDRRRRRAVAVLLLDRSRASLAGAVPLAAIRQEGSPPAPITSSTASTTASYSSRRRRPTAARAGRSASARPTAARRGSSSAGSAPSPPATRSCRRRSGWASASCSRRSVAATDRRAGSRRIARGMTARAGSSTRCPRPTGRGKPGEHDSAGGRPRLPDLRLPGRAVLDPRPAVATAAGRGAGDLLRDDGGGGTWAIRVASSGPTAKS